jgi:hypothetical protein
VPRMLAVGSDAREGSVRAPVGTRLACSLAAAVGVVFTVASFFPGYMSQDSVSQLLQGRAMSFTDWHPPVMSLLWGLLDRIVPGPAGMLILHNAMFWGGLSLFVYHLGFERLWAAAAILLVGLSPPVFSLLSTIWKDVGMGCSLVLGCGLLLRAERRHSRLAWVMAMISLWYALGVRHNAIIAVIPLAIWAALISRALFPSASSNPRVSAALRACLLVILLAVASAGVNKLLAQPGSPRPVQQILVHDLVAVSLETNRIYLPDYLTEALGSSEVSALKPLYTPNEIVPLFGCDANNRRFPIVAEPDKFARLWATWRSTIPRHPGAYIKHRARVFESEFGIGRNTICLPFWDGIHPSSLNVVFHPTSLNRSVMNILSRVKDGPLFRGWLYLALLIGLISMFWLGSHQDRAAALLIGLSGLLYAIAYFFVSTTCDFRMHWWSVLTVFLLALLAIASRLKAARSRV